MKDDNHFARLTNMTAFSPYIVDFNCQFRIAEGSCEISFEASRQHYHGAGGVHGAVIFFALDTAAMLAANSMVADVVVFTTNFTTYISRPVEEGILRAEANVVHAASSHLLAEAIAYGADGRSVARGSGTFMKSRIPLDPEIGYA